MPPRRAPAPAAVAAPLLPLPLPPTFAAAPIAPVAAAAPRALDAHQAALKGSMTKKQKKAHNKRLAKQKKDVQLAALVPSVVNTPSTTARPSRITNRRNMSEESLGDDMTEVEGHQLARIFWSVFDTPLLFTYLRAHTDFSRSLANEREVILDYLVEHGVPTPPEGTALRTLQGLWIDANPRTKLPTPGMLITSEDWDMEGLEDEEDDGEEEVEPQPKKRKTEGATTTLPLAPAPLSHIHASHASSSHTPSSSTLPSSCLTCAQPKPQGAAAQWKCTCGMRGDLESDAPANRTLLSLIQASIARPTPSNGQSGGGKDKTPLEREYIRLTNVDADRSYPLFASTTAVSEEDAFRELNLAFQSTMFAHPSKHSSQLVRVPCERRHMHITCDRTQSR